MNFDYQKALDIVTEKLISWFEYFTSMLPNFALAIIVMVVFGICAKLIKKIASNLMSRVIDKESLVNLTATIAHISVLMLGLFITLNILHLEQTVSSILAGAGIVGLALGFAFQDISANFISGIMMALRQPIKIGDIIESNGHFGKVQRIDLRVTEIKTFQGLHVLIPNKDVFQNPITNYTKTRERRIDLEVGVSYGDDLEQVQKIATAAVEELGIHEEGKPPTLAFTGFGDSSINFQIMIWIDYPDEPGFLKARSQVIIALKKAFDANNITIPFPIRTLDFGIKGGEKLSAMMKKDQEDTATR